MTESQILPGKEVSSGKPIEAHGRGAFGGGAPETTRLLMRNRKNYRLLSMIFMLSQFSINALAASEIEEQRAWQYEEYIDEMTDKKTASAFILSFEPDEKLAMLDLRCHGEAEASYQKMIVLSFVVHAYLGNYDQYNNNINIRVDKNDPISIPALSLDDTFFQNIADFDLYTQLMHGREVLVEGVDFRHKSHRAKFKLRGSQKAITDVLKFCDMSVSE